MPHSTELRGGVCPHSSKASRGEDLDIEEPVRGGYSPAFYFHSALTGMLSPTLIGDEVVQVREPRQKRLLTATGMVKPFHREQFPLDGVMGLIEQGAGHRHLRVFEHGIPARFTG
jgi:hypothetical protein